MDSMAKGTTDNPDDAQRGEDLEGSEGHGEDGSGDDDMAAFEDLSDVSSNTDIFNAEVDPDKTWTTLEDLDLERVDHISAQLRKFPSLPPDPSDPTHTRPFTDVTSGQKLPLWHCAFKGCNWCQEPSGDAYQKLHHRSQERSIYNHLRSTHQAQMN